MNTEHPCPLCGAPGICPSWFGHTSHGGHVFVYAECTGCRSLFIDPMPTEDVIGNLYGPEYAVADLDGAAPGSHARVLDSLRRRPAGRFVDWGCGDGRLLSAVQATGWDVLGIELDPDVVAAVTGRTGLAVTTPDDALAQTGSVDVVHLGDVIEHLPEPAPTLARILTVLRPGGLLLAQGPLEANTNLFLGAMKVARWTRRRAGTVPPYHLVLATARGQSALFTDVGLRELAFEITEVAWPAPTTLSLEVLRNPRPLGLWAARRLSQTLSATRPTWGNRYFYEGTRS